MLDIYYCYSAYYNKVGNTLEIFLLNILLVQKIRLIFAFIKRTLKKLLQHLLHLSVLQAITQFIQAKQKQYT